MFFDEEAEQCRQRALAYIGKPEAPFLLRVAREFDRLAREQGREVDGKNPRLAR